MAQSSFRQNLSILAITIFLVIGIAALYFSRNIVLVALIGIGLGVLISPLMGLLSEKLKIPRGVSAILFVILLFTGTAALGYGLFALVRDQARLFAEQAPGLSAAIRDQAARWLPSGTWIQEQINQLDLGRYARMLIQALFSGLAATTATVGFLLVIVAVSLFTAIHSGEYFRGFLSLFPAYLRPRTSEVMLRSASILRKWFLGQVIVMSISGLLTTLGLWLLGIQYWLLLGILTAVFGFIPYIGAFLTGFLTILVTLGSDPDKVWWVLVLYIGIQQIEGDITIPLVMRGTVRLPEVHLIILMLIMGSLFGIIGVFIAPPLLAVGRCIYLMTYVPKMNSISKPSTKFVTSGLVFFFVLLAGIEAGAERAKARLVLCPEIVFLSPPEEEFSDLETKMVCGFPEAEGTPHQAWTNNRHGSSCQPPRSRSRWVWM